MAFRNAYWVILYLSFFSCDFDKNCDGQDCPPDFYIFQYEITDKEGQNLYSSPNPKFDKENFRLKTVSGELYNSQYYGVDKNDLIWIKIYPNHSSFMAFYSDSESDELVFNYELEGGDCCPEYIRDFELSVNDAVVCSNCTKSFVTIVK